MAFSGSGHLQHRGGDGSQGRTNRGRSASRRRKNDRGTRRGNLTNGLGVNESQPTVLNENNPPRNKTNVEYSTAPNFELPATCYVNTTTTIPRSPDNLSNPDRAGAASGGHVARRGRGGKIKHQGRGGGDKTHSREQNTQQQLLQQNYNVIVKEDILVRTQVCKISTDIGNPQLVSHSNHFVNNGGKVKKYTSVSQFLRLCDAAPHVIANELQLDLKSFQKVILNSQKVGMQSDDMHKILVILLKLTEIGAVQILSEAFNSRSHQFHCKLQQYVVAVKSQKELKTVIRLFSAILELLPHAWNFLPVEDLVENMSQVSTPLTSDAKYISLILTYQNEQRINAVSMEENYLEYKSMSILPLTSEINNEMLPPKLRANIVDDCYESWEHYYDTQFKLLKEDFVASLRRGICDFRREEQIQNTSDVSRVNIADVRVYDNVTFTGLCFSTNGITLTIQFDCSKLRRVNWEHSKRLIYGSLLCFSCNYFETVIFASVIERDSKMLQKGKVTVKMESNADILSLSLNTGDYYTMIESQAHYETYYYILRSLQTAESDIMPFTNVLIETDCQHVQPPAYMCQIETRLRHPQPIFDMSDALGMRGCAAQNTFDVSKAERWPSIEQVQLDKSQLEAMKMALTQRVSVIQGPPGTGKTFIGLKIVQALLTNRDKWDPPRNSPLLVVCYTNHALDQFLEGIIDLSHSENDKSPKFSIARVGGRCQSEKVSEFNIKNFEIRKSRVPKRVYRGTCSIKNKVKSMGTELDRKYKLVQEKLKPTTSELIEFIAPIHLSQICSSVKNATTCNDNSSRLNEGLMMWLSCRDAEEQNEIEIAGTADTTSSSFGNEDFNDTMNSSLEESTMPKGEVDNTISVVSQAEIAEAHRMIDEPAMVFQYREQTDLHNGGMSTPEFNISSPSNTFSIPGGPLTHTTVSLIDNVFALSKSDRWRLYNYWKEQYIEKLCNHLRASFEDYTTHCKGYKEATQEEDLYVLETVDLIGMTTTGAAKYQHIIQRIKPKIVIVEEAAEVLESYIVSCLTAATQQLILIGDHKQLRPSPNEYHLACNYNLDISLFERLIRAGIPHATLQKQHRMRPEIAGLVCPSIYPTLDNHESVLTYESIKGVTTNLHFFNHKHQETSNLDTKSYSNIEEAKLVVKLCDYFLKQDYSPSQITVLTTYTGQLLTLKSLMPKDIFEGVRVTVVDNFQGEENDIIILSLVRSNTKKITGFLKIENRICVALSRARKGFYCFGNFDLLRSSCDTWDKILQYVERIGKVASSLVLCCSNHPDVKTTINTVKDFEKVPNGGCDRQCNALLDCGHVCTMFCHPKDLYHEYYKCQQPCRRTCNNGHPCPDKCFMECPPCEAPVNKVFPYCGHQAMLPCSCDPQDCVCIQPCENQLPCGHCCANICGVLCTEECMIPVERILHCKHSVILPCSVPTDGFYCRKTVLRALPCGHDASMDCSQSVDKYKCQFNVERAFPDCKHFITLPCSTPLDEVCCQEKVSKLLPCGHVASLECSKSVRKYKCQTEVKREFPDCKHSITLPCSTPLGKVCCQEKVSKPLPCGHVASLECSNSVDRYKCQTKINKKFPNCEHHISLPCSTPIDEVLCQTVVHKTLPCGHKSYAKCHQSVDKLKCRQKSKVTLACGHTFDEKCGKPIEECSKMVTKKFPHCGHRMRVKCCDGLPSDCTVKCNAKLLCGHQCTGTCTECHQGRMHKACPFQMYPLPCGHHTKEPCTTMRFPLCEYNCEYSCTHHSCTHACNQPCDPCLQPCSWSCEHYKCVKKCDEMCDRPRCDQPCGHKLQCRHPCIGICGEPCPRVCKICPNQKSKFQKLYMGRSPARGDSRYIQLSCNHLFEVKELDQLLDEQFTEYTVEPLKCPSCMRQIRFSHRYGNMIKRKKEMIRKLHDIMTEHVSEEQQTATIKKVFNSVPAHMQPVYNDVPDTPLLVSLLKRFTQFLPPIFEKMSSLFTHQHRHENLIIENEAGLYLYLKDMYKQYPEMSSFLQELIEFFEKAPPSAQKSQDVLSEALRILLLQMITCLKSAIPQAGEDHDFVQQLTETLRVDQPRLSVSVLTNHFNKLQKMAEGLKVKTNKIDLKWLQSTNAASFNGVWIICSNGHLYCKPRGLSRMDKETWQCPDCHFTP